MSSVGEVQVKISYRTCHRVCLQCCKVIRLWKLLMWFYWYFPRLGISWHLSAFQT